MAITLITSGVSRAIASVALLDASPSDRTWSLVNDRMIDPGWVWPDVAPPDRTPPDHWIVALEDFVDLKNPAAAGLEGPDGTDFLLGHAGHGLPDRGSGLESLFGDGGNAAVDGGNGNHTPVGNADDNTLYGGNGNDLIQGRLGGDILFGGSGNDTVDGDDGDDVLYGEAGQDLIFGDQDNDRLFGGAEDDTLFGGEGADRLFGDGGDDTLRGSNGDDTLVGNTGNDTLYGGNGNDLIQGRLDDDSLFGGSGNDTVDGDDGDDILYGEAGQDLIFGDQNSDRLFGGAAGDTLFGGSGADRLFGGGGNDTVHGSNGDDTLVGNAGNDMQFGGNGNDLIQGRVGGDRLSGGRGNDSLEGDDGDDVLFGGPGQDLLFGGQNDDALFGGTEGDTLFGGNGADQLFGGAGNDRLQGSNGNDTLAGSAGNDSFVIDNLTGTPDLVTDYAEGEDLFDLDGLPFMSFLATDFDLFVRIGRASGALTLQVDLDGGGNSFVDVALLDGFAGATVDVTIGGAFFSTVAPAPVIDLTSLTATEGFIIQGDVARDRAGSSVSSAGDVNGDGFDDVIVGAFAGHDGGYYAGEAYVVFGAPDGAGRQVIDLTTLAAVDGFIIQGDAVRDFAGRSVSSAGDVNGDGFEDVIVGADGGDDGGILAGEAYVVFGTDAGFGAPDGAGRQVIDLTALAAAEGFIIQGDSMRDFAGRSVSSAGDMNGDGFDDVIVGAFAGYDGGAYAGEAYVVFGRGGVFGAPDGTGHQVIDLTALVAAEGFIIQGDVPGDRAGGRVSSAGDVNGDGFDDVIVGAYFADDGGFYAGEAYVVFGTGGAFGTPDGAGRQVIDLSSLTAAEGFIIQGDAAGDEAGRSVSSAGDVNGDGFDDLLVGASEGDDGGSFAGEAYVVFGTDSGFGAPDGAGRQMIDLSSLTATEGFVIQGDAARDRAGYSVSSAGDVNGDGFDDLIVGASQGDDGGAYAGEAYVIFGTDAGFGVVVAGRQVIDLTILGVGEGFIVQGDAAGDFLGTSVSSAGDVNGDGFDDLILGAPFGDDGGDIAGEAYVVLGGAFGAPETPVVTNGTAAAEILRGGLGTDSLNGNGGADVFRAGAGDDILAVGDLSFQRIDGGNGTDTLRLAGTGLSLDLTALADNRADSVEVIDLAGGGNSLTLGKLDVLQLLGSEGLTTLRVLGDGTNAASLQGIWFQLGPVAEGATTFNQFLNFDGTTRVLVESGVAVNSAAEVELSDVETGFNGFVINGVSEYDFSGSSVSGAGDVNGDGLDDLIVGAYLDDPNGFASGASFVVFGKADGTAVELSDIESGSGGFVINGVALRDSSGRSVSGAGDVNGDGLDDLIVGAFGDDPNGSASGASFVVFGKADGTAVELSTVEAGSGGFVINGVSAYDGSGVSVSSAGDVDGDGLNDLIVGASGDDPNGSASGASFVVFGKADGIAVELSTVEAGAGGFVINGVSAYDRSGVSVSGAGDVNGDGLDDLIVGASFDDPNGDYSGASFVVFGKADGTAVELSAVEAGTGGFVINGVSAYDRSGVSVSGAGDVDGDGLDDLIVGAFGASFVVFGKADGTAVELSDVEAGTGGFVLNGMSGLDYSALSVSGAGDVNGDGLNDLIVGASGASPNGFISGASFVVFGKADGRAVELSDIEAGTGGFVMNGVSVEDQSGSVNGAGDVNGDGFADLIVGAFGDDPNGDYSGASFVVFGGNFTGSVDLLGQDGDQLLSGSAAAEVINGGGGADTLAGGGGADVLIGGEGDDVLAVGDTGFERLQGGNGSDTLRVEGGGALDLTLVPDNRIEEIEAIDLGVGGAADAAALTLNLQELLNLSTASNRLLVTGDASDSVDPGSLTDSGTDEMVDGFTFDVFTDAVNGEGEALLIQQGIVVV